jgi:hypothetical protein
MTSLFAANRGPGSWESGAKPHTGSPRYHTQELYIASMGPREFTRGNSVASNLFNYQ